MRGGGSPWQTGGGEGRGWKIADRSFCRSRGTSEDLGP